MIDNLDGKVSILVIDDSVSNIEIMNKILGDDYEVLFATDSLEGYEIATSIVPDLILLDIMMPGIDGYEICRRLKQNNITRDIPVIFITGMNQEEDETKGLEIGAIDYITKPINPYILKARIKNHIQLKKYRDYLELQSSLDGLTQIANRRQFDKTYTQEWLRAVRNQTPISLILLDIDYFKQYNDNYGHLAGDDCLKKVASNLAKAFRRPADLLARYGGEEFICVLPETNHSGAKLIANHLKDITTSLNIRHEFSTVAKIVTISIGVGTVIPQKEIPSSYLIEFTDKLLYEAKGSGRNQIKCGEMGIKS